MKLHRFYINQTFKENEDVTLTDSEVLKQWKSVLRFQVGRPVVLFNADGVEFHGVIDLLSKEKATVSYRAICQNAVAPRREVTLYISIIKKDKFEWVVQKCTELGVSHFVPVLSGRTEKVNVNMERLEKIIQEAVEQSGRVTLPTVSQPVTLEEAIAGIEESASVSVDAPGADSEMKWYALEEGGKMLREVIGSDNVSPIGIFIGPEGGWTDEEKELFGDRNVSLGDMTLRAETASVAISTLLLL